MKRNLLILAAVGGMLFSSNLANAQQEVVVAEEATVNLSNIPCKTTYLHDWHKNWWIQIGAGAQLPLVEDTRLKGDWSKQITAIYGVGVGHWFSPYFAFRFTGTYSAIHWKSNDEQSKAKNANLNVELMWDMFNSLGGVNPNRVFTIIPFIGFGGTFTWDYKGIDGNVFTRHGDLKTNTWSLPISAGLQFRFRLCKYVDFWAEARAMFYPDTWNRFAINRPLDGNAIVMGGFNFNIGGRDFVGFNPCDYLDYINRLNGQVNDLRGALATTAAALAAAEAQLPCPEPVVVKQEAPAPAQEAAPFLSCVRFKINSAVVSNEEKVNVFNVAEYLKKYPNSKVVIRAYADKDTGSSKYNMKLSQRRAQSVYDMLVKEYGIDKDRLKCEPYGSDVQPYKVNNWNRIVIVNE